MNLDLLSQITALVGFLIISIFVIYKYNKQNKDFKEKF